MDIDKNQQVYTSVQLHDLETDYQEIADERWVIELMNDCGWILTKDRRWKQKPGVFK